MKIKLALAIAITAALYMIVALVIWNSITRPYERPTRHSPDESRAIKYASKIHGNVTFITDNTRIYFKRDGREITILSRR